MLNKFFIALFIFISFSQSIYANEIQLIIDQLIRTDNITFDFEQSTNSKKEMGTCILVFDNKLSCNYKDSVQKRILINDKILVVQQKRYDKIYFYPISNSPFIKIFNKSNLVSLIEKSNYKINDKIELTYVDQNKNKIIIFFEKNSYNLIGWKVVDQLQNIINFSLKIKKVNSEINLEIFKVPSVN